MEPLKTHTTAQPTIRPQGVHIKTIAQMRTPKYFIFPIYEMQTTDPSIRKMMALYVIQVFEMKSTR